MKWWIGDPSFILTRYTFEEAIVSKQRWTSYGWSKIRGILNHDTKYGDGIYKIESYTVDGVPSDKYKDFIGIRVDAGSIGLISQDHYHGTETDFNYGIEIELKDGEQPYFLYSKQGDWGVFDIRWTDPDNHRHELTVLT